jgi:multidrug efflux pump subunit AcrA (membrane-fusion protein)
VVRQGEFVRELLLTGELQAVRSLSVKAPQTRVFQMRIQFMAEEGSRVRKGDPLLGFDNAALADQVRDLETRILDAETQVVAKRSELASALKDLEIELAEKEYERERSRLDAEVDPDVLSRKEYGERQLAYTKAQEELDEVHERVKLTRERGEAELDVLVIERDRLQRDIASTRDGLSLLTILAPADGLVVYETRPGTTLPFQEGDSCWPGQGVLQLPDLSEMQVLFHVSEVDAPLLTPGTAVEISLDAYPDQVLPGTIGEIPSMAVKRSETSKVAVFKVPAKLGGSWAGEMKPGMSARGRVVLERVPDAWLVPRDAVMLVDGRPHLRRRGPDGTDLPGDAVEVLARNALFYRLAGPPAAPAKETS